MHLRAFASSSFRRPAGGTERLRLGYMLSFFSPGKDRNSVFARFDHRSCYKGINLVQKSTAKYAFFCRFLDTQIE